MAIDGWNGACVVVIGDGATLMLVAWFAQAGGGGQSWGWQRLMKLVVVVSPQRLCGYGIPVIARRFSFAVGALLDACCGS